MLKDFFALTKVFVYAHRWELLIATGVQVLALVTMNSLIVPDDIVGRAADNTKGILMVFSGAALFLGHLWVFHIIARAFNVADRSRWFSKLPFSRTSKDLFPVLYLTTSGLVVLHFFPLGVMKAGATLFFIGIPVAMFLISKYSKTEALAAIKNSFFIFPIGMLGFFSIGWLYMRPQLIGELWFILIYFILWLFFEKMRKVYLLFPALVVVAYFFVAFINIQNDKPKNYSEAVANYSFYPTEKTYLELKKVVLDKISWENPDQFRLTSYVNYWSKKAIRSFSDQEVIEFLENVAMNYKLWKSESFSMFRKQNFGIYGLGDGRFWLHDSMFPLEYREINENVENYMYENWKSSEVFCGLLPVRSTDKYLNKLFRDPECRNVLRGSIVWQSYFVKGDEFKAVFEKYLLEAYEKSPALTRTNLMRSLINGWHLDFIKYRDQREITFNQRDITAAEIEKYKSEAYATERALLSRISENPSQKNVYSKIRKFSKGGVYGRKEDAFPVNYTCILLLRECAARTMKEYRRYRTLVAHLYDVVWSLSESRTLLYRKRYLLKEENWEKVKGLLSTFGESEQ